MLDSCSELQAAWSRSGDFNCQSDSDSSLFFILLVRPYHLSPDSLLLSIAYSAVFIAPALSSSWSFPLLFSSASVCTPLLHCFPFIISLNKPNQSHPLCCTGDCSRKQRRPRRDTQSASHSHSRKTHRSLHSFFRPESSSTSATITTTIRPPPAQILYLLSHSTADT